MPLVTEEDSKEPPLTEVKQSTDEKIKQFLQTKSGQKENIDFNKKRTLDDMKQQHHEDSETASTLMKAPESKIPKQQEVGSSDATESSIGHT